MLEQVSSGLFLAARAVAESLRLLKMPWNDFTSDSVCGGICAPAVCLQASWLCWHVFPVICHPCLPLGDGCDRRAISVWWQPGREGRVSDSSSLVTDSLGNAEMAAGPWPWLVFDFGFATPSLQLTSLLPPSQPRPCLASAQQFLNTCLI